MYEHPTTIPLSLMRKWVSEAITAYRGNLSSHLPLSIKQRQKLIDPTDALVQLHQPPAQASVAALNSFSSPAHRAIIFDELFYLQLGLAIRKKKNRGSRGVLVKRGGEQLTKKWQRFCRLS